MKGMICSFRPMPIKASTSRFTHSDAAERGEQITIKYLDISNASRICRGKLPGINSEVSLNTGRISRGKSVRPFRLAGRR